MDNKGGDSSVNNKTRVRFSEKIGDFYHNNYKTLFWIPVIILLLALIQIGYQTATTGDFINKGIAFKGGVSITVDTDYKEVGDLELQLKAKFPQADINTRITSEEGKQKSIIIESTTEARLSDLTYAIKEIISKEDSSINIREFYTQEFSPEFASDFFRTTIIAVIVAFVFMATVVFFYFRTFIPSVAVVAAALCDIVITVAVFNLLGLRLAPGGIAAFLMLIGYSVDTDILLTTRAIVEKTGTLKDRINSAIKTGMLMTITSIAAVTVGLIFSEAEILKQIMTVVLIGLFVDIISTWIQNVAILRWFLEKKGERI